MIDEFLTEHFKLSEFACKDGSEFPDDVKDNLKVLAKELQKLRNELGCAVILTSGYRSPEYNKKVGGSKKSYHMKGMAADIYTHLYSPKEIYQIICSMIKKGKLKQGGVGCYKTFVHYDYRGYAVRKEPGSRYWRTP